MRSNYAVIPLCVMAGFTQITQSLRRRQLADATVLFLGASRRIAARASVVLAPRAAAPLPPSRIQLPVATMAWLTPSPPGLGAACRPTPAGADSSAATRHGRIGPGPPDHSSDRPCRPRLLLGVPRLLFPRRAWLGGALPSTAERRAGGTPSLATRRPAQGRTCPARSSTSAARGCAYCVNPRGKQADSSLRLRRPRPPSG